jgi:hypothetical protein
MQQEIQEFILRKWNSNNIDRFPGPQPISIERVHFRALKNKRYFVCEKTDGVRHFLVCFTDSKNRKICALVNRSFQFTLWPLTIPRDTLLDGELIGDCFIVHDAVCIRGEDLRKQDLATRLSRAVSLCKIIIPSQIRVTVKPMHDLDCISHIHLGESTDGLIFTPVNEEIRMGTHRTLFKWKPREKCTVDFILKDGYLCIQNDSRFERIQPYASGAEGAIYECIFEGQIWTPIVTRIDKSHPNNKRTLERTLVNIKENILFSELVQEFGRKDTTTTK